MPGMTTQQRVEPDAFTALVGPASAAPVQTPAPDGPAARGGQAPPLSIPAGHHGRRSAAALAGAAVVLVVATALVVSDRLAAAPADRASVAALAAPQQAADQLYAEDVTRLAVEATSTRLLVVTADGAHYVARTPSGELCLVRVANGEAPTEVCVPDRVGADTTIGAVGAGQVRLVADGAPLPAGADGWQPAGPNVWVRG